MNTAFRGPASRLRPAVYLTRAVFASAAAVASGRGAGAAVAMVRELYGDDEPTRLLLRGAVSPTSLSSIAGTIAATAVADFVASLMPYGAAAQLIAEGLRVSLADVAKVSVPRRVGSPDPALAWVPEGAPIPIKNYALDSVALEPRKLAVGGALTHEMAQHEPVVEQLLREDAAASLDASLLSNAAGDAARPAGVLNGVTALTATAGGGETAMVNDLENLAVAVGTGTVTYVLPPGLAATASLRLPHPPAILVSAALAAGTAIAIDPRALVSGFGIEPRIEASKEATIHFDTAPQPLAVPGVPPPADPPSILANPVRSAFQQDLVVIRLVLPAAWVMRAPHVAWVTGANWT